MQDSTHLFVCIHMYTCTHIHIYVTFKTLETKPNRKGSSCIQCAEKEVGLFLKLTEVSVAAVVLEEKKKREK